VAKRSTDELLNRAIDAMLASRPPAPEERANRSVLQLMSLAEALRELPRPDFKESLKSDLQRRATMSEGSAASTGVSARTTPAYMREGFNNISPYILVNGADRFMEFLKTTFQGTERIRVPRPDGSMMHGEVAIGNSVIEMGDANEQYPHRPTTVHVYVDDVDAAYNRALEAGATSVFSVSDQPWGDRLGSVRDEFGNVWYIATPKGWTPGPEGVLNVQPYLHLRNAHEMIPFAEAAFGAEVLGVGKSKEGLILHATIKVGRATFEIDEAHGEFQPIPCYLHAYVPDADAMYAQAVRAGAVGVEPPATRPYGERSGTIRDPFGNTWFLATNLGG
jgi:PhnB protein